MSCGSRGKWRFRAPKFKNFLEEHAPRRWSSLVRIAFRLPTFFLCVHLQTLRYTPEIYKNLENLLFKTVSGGHLSSESLSTQLPLLWFRCKQGTSWNAAYYFENACSWKFHRLNAIHNRISWCKRHCFIQWDCNSFSESDICYACHKCFEWKVLRCLKEESRITLGLPWRKNGWTIKTRTT